jgi:hypothetical protein
MIEPNAAPDASSRSLNPGDRLIGKDAEGLEAVFVVLSVHPRVNPEGLTTVSYVLRQRDSWTLTIGEAALQGESPRFRKVDDASVL